MTQEGRLGDATTMVSPTAVVSLPGWASEPQRRGPAPWNEECGASFSAGSGLVLRSSAALEEALDAVDAGAKSAEHGKDSLERRVGCCDAFAGALAQEGRLGDATTMVSTTAVVTPPGCSSEPQRSPPALSNEEGGASFSAGVGRTRGRHSADWEEALNVADARTNSAEH